MAGFALTHLSADSLGLEPWARAALAGRPRPRNLPGMILPDSLDAMPRLASSGKGFDEDARAALSHTLEANLTSRESHVHVIESVRALKHPDAALVVVGQQPGFLGGPLYNVYKAVHVIRLARALSETWGTPVLPAFWNHADDHDVAEVHHLWVTNANLDLRKVALAGMSSGRTPLSELVLEEGTHRLGAIAELLRQTLPESASRDQAIDLFLPKNGETLAGAFTRVLLELFGARGLIVIEPEWIREPLSRSLAQIVSSDVAELLERGGAALEAAGSRPAIDARTAALLFRLEGGKRRALRLAPEGFRYDGEEGSRTGVELAAEILQEPSVWSPGALLRPIVQDRTLPVVAYVGGWGELAYHAQLPPLRDGTRTARTAFVPRLSATLIDPPTLESLRKLELDVGEVLAARGRLGEDAPSAAESEVAARLRGIAGALKKELLGEQAALALVDRGLAQQLKKVADQSQALVEKLAQKADRVEANAGGRGRRHLRRLNNSLFPRESPQERVIGALEIVARHGTAWIDRLENEIEPLPTEHLVVTLETGDGR